MKYESLLKTRLTNSLYRVLEHDELILHYQPLVSAAVEKIVGVEALVRWRHPEMGQLSPSLFIPLAEHTGLINPIGAWVLTTACRQSVAWRRAGLPPVRMAVNVSVHQLRHADFIPGLKRILEETGMEATYLELEITESAAMREDAYIFGVLDELRALGVQISIDDFGTEYSSLGRLNMMPINRIKMDMQFVRGINKGERERALARGIINLVHNLGLEVVAEGVEDAAQLEFLRQNLCDEIQGFYFYRPVDAESVKILIRRNQPEAAVEL
jgi:EAL domain-containing protein (putative c-di-GMP-specific phosphodiesterase class I)